MPEEQKSPLRIEPEKLIPGKGLDEMDLSVNDSSIELISRENPIAWFGNLFTGAFTASIFQCDHQKFRAKDHSFDEFILILEGELTLTEDKERIFSIARPTFFGISPATGQLGLVNVIFTNTLFFESISMIE